MGKLQVKIICCRKITNGSFFDKIDPYVKLVVGSKNFRTRAINNTENPNYDESFSIFCSPVANDDLQLELWDANTFSDTLVARAVVPLRDLVKDQRVLKVVRWDKGGEIHVELCADFTPGVAEQPSSPGSYSSSPNATMYAAPTPCQAPTPPAPAPVYQQQPQPQSVYNSHTALPYQPVNYGAQPYAYPAAPPPQQQQPQALYAAQAQQNPYGTRNPYQQQPPQYPGAYAPSPYAAQYNSVPAPQQPSPYANQYASQYPQSGGGFGDIGGVSYF